MTLWKMLSRPSLSCEGTANSMDIYATPVSKPSGSELRAQHRKVIFASSLGATKAVLFY